MSELTKGSEAMTDETDYAAWLSGLTVGSEVGVFVNGSRFPMIRIVDRTTPTQVVVGGEKFSRRTGRNRAGGYSDKRLEPLTDEMRSKARRRAAVGVITSFVNAPLLDRSSVPTETLEQIVEAMRAAKG